ncbi:MAG: hypothetical protein JWM89_1614 [Acidimicrobiales bacterium]|nr:hypothetical protein [Acidimicrobiales bacterium]
MSELVLLTYVASRNGLHRAIRRVRAAGPDRPDLSDEAGEGVISAAIAVLIMAFLGALMWMVFKEMFTSTTAKTKSQVDLIGG